jgi:nucleoside-diphosphate-sugar epimerase
LRRITMKRAIDLVRIDAQSVVDGRIQHLERLKGEHVFVTGGTGFLGAWLLEIFKVLNEEYGFSLCVTIYSRNSRSFASRWPHLAKTAGVKFIDGDIRHLVEVPRDVRYIIHAAALTDRRLLASQPSAVAEVNAVGTLRIMRAANILEDIQRLVLLSSGLVPGNQSPDRESIDEAYAGPSRCTDVSAVYADSKRLAEVVAQSAISEFKLPVVILRPFAFVGPYLSLQLPWAVTDFIRDSFNGGPVRIMGDGSTVRSLMYGSDYAFWVLMALVNGRPRETYNVGSPHAVDMVSLAQLITRSFNPVPQILTGTGQLNHERSRLIPNIEKARRELGVELTVSLPEAIKRTINWNRYLINP